MGTLSWSAEEESLGLGPPKPMKALALATPIVMIDEGTPVICAPPLVTLTPGVAMLVRSAARLSRPSAWATVWKSSGNPVLMVIGWPFSSEKAKDPVT